MADTMEGVPQWKRDLIRRKRAGHQSIVRRDPVDMLLQAPAHLDITDPADLSEDGSNTERSTPLRDTDHSVEDSGEELTYGPGIVKKLKSRYLSLTLREANKCRPALHGLRRATSLEHVLEDEKPAAPPRKYQPIATTNNTRPTRYRTPTRTADAVRRARSVDALARCDSRSETEDLLSPVERESPVHQSHPLPSPTSRPKRPMPLLKETERPPPDLVKQALKIFEGQPGKKLRTPPNTGQVADKVKSYNKTNGARLPRPAIPPRGPLLSPEHRQVPVATQTTPSLMSRPPPSPKKFVNNSNKQNDKERSLSPVYVNRHPVILAPTDSTPVLKPNSDLPVLRGIKPLDLKSPEISPRNSMLKSPDLLSPKEKPLRFVSDRNGGDKSNAIKDPYVRTSTPDPEIITQPATTEISYIAPTKPHIRSNNTSDRITSDSSSEDEGSFTINDDEDGQPKTKVVEKSALEKISSAGTTTQFSFSNNTNGFNGDVKKSYLPSAKINNYNNSNSSSINNSKKTCAINNAKIKPKVPDLLQVNNNNAAGVLANKPITVVDSKLITSNNKESLLRVNNGTSNSSLMTDLRQFKDVESSPALVDYESQSSPPRLSQPTLVQQSTSNNHNNKTSNQLTTREIEKNLINTSKTLAEHNNKDLVLHHQHVREFTVQSEESLHHTAIITEQSIHREDRKETVVESLTVVEEIFKDSANSTSCGVSNISDDSICDMRNVNKSVVHNNTSETVSMMTNGIKLGGGKKPQWHQQESTTMLFDFSKSEKGVPDYIENDGIIRRNKPKIGIGVISIEGLSGESCTDGGSDDSGEEEWARRPPSPCDVAFENDNVLINGRSNMSAGKPRARHLKIQFDESLTTTFEYPSEASLGEEHFAGTNSSSSPASPIATGGPLSSYTPSKVTLQADSFQLGITRSQEHNGDTTDATNTSSNGTSSSSEDDRAKNSDEPYLKPCQEEQSHTWSHETHIGAGDLLF